MSDARFDHQERGSGATTPELRVNVGPLALANPVMPASGCFGPELVPLVDTSRLGAVVTKTVFSDVRSGNPAHRLTEVDGGMINAVGIPSPGSDAFLNEVLPAYFSLGPPVIVSVGGLSHDEYLRMADRLADQPLAALEVNVSCPNLEHDGLAIGADPEQLSRLVTALTSRSPHPILVKLTPNVSELGPIAAAAESAGATALTVTNTFVGLAIDRQRRTPVLGNITGGVSGRGILPLALRAVHTVAQAVETPVIGCGGVSTAEDVVDYLLAGASAVQVGTATFTHPDAMTRILDDLPRTLAEVGAHSAQELVRGLSTFSTASTAPTCSIADPKGLPS